jgi:hypothetical protein
LEGYTNPREDSTGESEGWDNPQRREGALWIRVRLGTDRKGGGAPTDEPADEPTDQFCSSCNQKKPLIAFGRFLTCNICRQRNTKANRVRKAKQKAILRPKATKEQLEQAIQALGNTSKYILRGKLTRPLTIEDYLNKGSS